MQKNKDGVVSYTLEYLEKNLSETKNIAALHASVKNLPETKNIAAPQNSVKKHLATKSFVAPGNVIKKHSEQFFNIFSSEIGIPEKIHEEAEKTAEEKANKKPKLNLKVYAEEITNIFKQEAERVRLEEEAIELERIEQIARKKIEEETLRIKLQEEEELRAKIKKEAEKIKLEEDARAQLEKEVTERIKLEEDARAQLEKEVAEKIRLEEVANMQLEEDVKNESLNEEFIDNTQHQTKEAETNISYYAKKESRPLNENPVDLQNVVNNGDFVTFKDLQKHYTDFINKVQVQLGSMGGGGEVLLKRLDDIDFNTFSDGYVIKYNQQTKKFYGAQESLSAEVLDGGEF
jgi:hypothetical protein